MAERGQGRTGSGPREGQPRAAAGTAVETRRPSGPQASRGASPSTRSGTAVRPVRRMVRRGVVVRRVDPWSVLKVSLVFYSGLLVAAMVALTLLWAVVNRVGVLDTLLSFATELQLEVEIDGGSLARVVLLLGLLNVVVWSAVNVFLSFLYNLIADMVGGVEMTIAEEE